MDFYDSDGQRLYLTVEERKLFLEVAKNNALHSKARTLARTIAYTGCRLSEALELTTDRVDFSKGELTFRTLKKRKTKTELKQFWRSVPVPVEFLDELNLIHHIKDSKAPSPLWDVTRKTGWAWVKDIMSKAGIKGSQATAKGLRHAFAVVCIENDVPLTTIRQMMGHSSINTTAFYLQLVGAETRKMISRTWE